MRFTKKKLSDLGRMALAALNFEGTPTTTNGPLLSPVAVDLVAIPKFYLNYTMLPGMGDDDYMQVLPKLNRECINVARRENGSRLMQRSVVNFPAIPEDGLPTPAISDFLVCAFYGDYREYALLNDSVIDPVLEQHFRIKLVGTTGLKALMASLIPQADSEQVIQVSSLASLELGFKVDTDKIYLTAGQTTEGTYTELMSVECTEYAELDDYSTEVIVSLQFTYNEDASTWLLNKISVMQPETASEDTANILPEANVTLQTLEMTPLSIIQLVGFSSDGLTNPFIPAVAYGVEMEYLPGFGESPYPDAYRMVREVVTSEIPAEYANKMITVGDVDNHTYHFRPGYAAIDDAVLIETGDWLFLDENCNIIRVKKAGFN